MTGWGQVCMPCSKKARTAGTVHSGLKTRESPPRVRKEYICFSTMSEVSPKVGMNKSACSMCGVRMFLKPYALARSPALSSKDCQYKASFGRMSLVPLGVFRKSFFDLDFGIFLLWYIGERRRRPEPD